MTPKLAVLHSASVTVEPLKRLAMELIPGVEVVSFVDDSILPQLAANGGDVSAVAERLSAYAGFAQGVGADVILSACSSVGELVDALRARVHVPVVRIDEAMAAEALRRGGRIGVAATLPTTLGPTLALLRREAERSGSDATFETRLVDGAYRRLAAGDTEGHDRVLADALQEMAAEADVVVLAQASMARVLDRLPDALRDRFLSSPRLAMLRVRETLARQEGTGDGDRS